MTEAAPPPPGYRAAFGMAEDVEYRPAPGLPGYLVGADRSVWSTHRVGRPPTVDTRPIRSWRRLTIQHDSGRDYVVVHIHYRSCRRPVDRLVEAAFGPA